MLEKTSQARRARRRRGCGSSKTVGCASGPTRSRPRSRWRYAHLRAATGRPWPSRCAPRGQTSSSPPGFCTAKASSTSRGHSEDQLLRRLGPRRRAAVQHRERRAARRARVRPASAGEALLHLERLRRVRQGQPGAAGTARVPGDACRTTRYRRRTIYTLPEKLREAQGLFDATGGLHAAALFDAEGELVALQGRRGEAQRDGQARRAGRYWKGRLPLTRPHRHGQRAQQLRDPAEVPDRRRPRRVRHLSPEQPRRGRRAGSSG